MNSFVNGIQPQTTGAISSHSSDRLEQVGDVKVREEAVTLLKEAGISPQKISGLIAEHAKSDIFGSDKVLSLDEAEEIITILNDKTPAERANLEVDESKFQASAKSVVKSTDKKIGTAIFGLFGIIAAVLDDPVIMPALMAVAADAQTEDPANNLGIRGFSLSEISSFDGQIPARSSDIDMDFSYNKTQFDLSTDYNFEENQVFEDAESANSKITNSGQVAINTGGSASIMAFDSDMVDGVTDFLGNILPSSDKALNMIAGFGDGVSTIPFTDFSLAKEIREATGDGGNLLKENSFAYITANATGKFFRDCITFDLAITGVLKTGAVMSAPKGIANITDEAISVAKNSDLASAGWKTLPSGGLIKQEGKYWVKNINPKNSKLAQAWQRSSLNQQASYLSKLDNMAPAFAYKKGFLVTEHVGEFTGSKLATWFNGSSRVGTFLNDIHFGRWGAPSNAGGLNTIFDPALPPLQKLIYESLGPVSVAGVELGLTLASASD